MCPVKAWNKFAMSTRKRSGRTTAVQFSKMLSFMEKHPDLGLFRMSGPNAKQEASELWQTLKDQLNCEVGPEKTSSQWQNTWSDWKVNVKRKWREISKKQNKTDSTKHLLPIEEKLLNFLGNSVVDGDGPEFVDVGIIPVISPSPTPPSRKKIKLRCEDEMLDKRKERLNVKNIEYKLDKINETLERKNDILETISKSLIMQNKLLEKLINKT